PRRTAATPSRSRTSRASTAARAPRARRATTAIGRRRRSSRKRSAEEVPHLLRRLDVVVLRTEHARDEPPVALAPARLVVPAALDPVQRHARVAAAPDGALDVRAEALRLRAPRAVDAPPDLGRALGADHAPAPDAARDLAAA